jgi:hypothetical protein
MRVKKSPYKNAIVCVRFPVQFKRIMEQLAYNEGMDISTWLRNLVVAELKRRGIISETMGTISFEAMLERMGEREGGQRQNSEKPQGLPVHNGK